MFIDSHCHINFPELSKNIDNVLSNMKEKSITHALCVSVTLDNFESVLKLANEHKNIFASVGVHPDYEDITEPDIKTLTSLAKNDKVVAIGETGLDYFRLTGELLWQKERFRTHIRAAVESKLPLIIHTRNAREDTIQIMKEENASSAKGVMHCFTETYEMAKQAIDQDFYISFSGIITFKNAESLRETVKKIPLDRMLIETDSPYLAPPPFRGKRNEPSYSVHTAKVGAEIFGLDYSEFSYQTQSNFNRLFSKVP